MVPSKIKFWLKNMPLVKTQKLIFHMEYISTTKEEAVLRSSNTWTVWGILSQTSKLPVPSLAFTHMPVYAHAIFGGVIEMKYCLSGLF